MPCIVCQRKIIKVMEFRYTCSGCDQIFCDKHLDWKFGHKCSGYEKKLKEHNDKLINIMPQIGPKKISSIFEK